MPWHGMSPPHAADTPPPRHRQASATTADAPLPRPQRKGDGLLDWKEIMTALCTLQAPGEESLRFCFDIYDEDNSGWLSKAELEKVLGTVMNCKPGKPHTAWRTLSNTPRVAAAECCGPGCRLKRLFCRRWIVLPR